MLSLNTTSQGSSVSLQVTISKAALTGCVALASITLLSSLRARGRSGSRPTKPSSPPKSPFLAATNPADFLEWGHELLAWIVDYRDGCKSLPVVSRVEPNYLQKALPGAAPEEAEGWRDIMRGEKPKRGERRRRRKEGTTSVPRR